jgi:hypothetical protein
MVLKTEHDRTAQWSQEINNWIVEDRPRYCWTDTKGNVLTEWFATFDLALEYLIKSGA